MGEFILAEINKNTPEEQIIIQKMFLESPIMWIAPYMIKVSPF